MRYKVSDTDVENRFSSNDFGSKEKQWDSSIRCSSVLVVLLSLLLAAICFCTMTYMLIQQNSPKPCLTHECVSSANRMLLAMDRSVKPCDDFYQFACGGWEKLNPVPDYTAKWDQIEKLRERISKDLRMILEADPSPELPKSVLKAMTLYKACIDEDNEKSNNTEPIKRILEQIGLTSEVPEDEPTLLSYINLDNNTILEDVNLTSTEATEENITNWQIPVGKIRRLIGINVLISITVSEDVRNTSRNRLSIEQISPLFSEHYLLNPSQHFLEISTYKKYITSMIKIYDPSANAEQFAEDILSFSTALAQILTPNSVKRSGSHLFHEVSIKQLYEGATDGPKAWKNMNWQEYFKYVFENTSVELKTDDRIIVMDLPYLQKLSVVLASTEPIIIEKFIWWNVFSTLAPLTVKQFKDFGFEFFKTTVGLQEKNPRWRTCTDTVNRYFGSALSYVYIKKHFNEKSKQKAFEMVEDVRVAFSKTVMQLNWMDNLTRYTTLNKLKAIRNYVGYASWNLDPKMLDYNYNSIEIANETLFDMYVKLSSNIVKNTLEMLRKKPKRDRWVTTPTQVNAFYSAALNSATVPAAILQPPFYDNGLESINYGSIGAIMGHEITHGFDDQGRRYDENGNLKQWWSAATLEHYQGKVQCFIDQYNQYHMPQLQNYTVNGYKTQGENIADNGGIRSALKAYNIYTMRNPYDKKLRLPSMEEYSPEQLFFLAFAQTWCGHTTVGGLKSKIINEVHSPNKIRVIGSLSNFKEFSDTWQCPTGSPMNPEHKCVLW